MQRTIELSPREFREAIEGTPLAPIYDYLVIEWRGQGEKMADAVVASLLAFLIQLGGRNDPHIRIR